MSQKHKGNAGDGVTSEAKRIVELEERLANANDLFKRKAAEVLDDKLAVILLAKLYPYGSLDIGYLDLLHYKYEIPLARLTAANFAEIGASVIWITEAGEAFIESLEKANVT